MNCLRPTKQSNQRNRQGRRHEQACSTSIDPIHISLPCLHSVQRKIYNSKARYKVVIAGRRTGKDIACVVILFNYITTNTNYDAKIWCVAPNFKLTNVFEQYFLKYLSPFIAPKGRNKVERTYKLITGHTVEFKSADSASLVGMSVGLVIFDEAGLHPNKEAWERDLHPCLIDCGGNAIFITTPRGNNWIRDLYNKGEDPLEDEWESFHYTTWDNPYIKRSELEKIKKSSSDLLYRQEIMAEFLDDSNSFFRNIDNCLYVRKIEAKSKFVIKEFECPRCEISTKIKMSVSQFLMDDNDENKIIPTCICGSRLKLKHEENKYYYVGVDLAKIADFTVITVIEYDKALKKLRVVEVDRFNEVSWRIQKNRIRKMCKKYPHSVIYMDETGLGSPIVEDLQHNGIAVNGYKFTNESKLKLCQKLAIALENEEVEIPNDENVLINELKAFEMKKTAFGNWRLEAPSDKHDDCVMSFALAIWDAPTMKVDDFFDTESDELEEEEEEEEEEDEEESEE